MFRCGWTPGDLFGRNLRTWVKLSVHAVATDRRGDQLRTASPSPRWLRSPVRLCLTSQLGLVSIGVLDIIVGRGWLDHLIGQLPKKWNGWQIYKGEAGRTWCFRNQNICSSPLPVRFRMFKKKNHHPGWDKCWCLRTRTGLAQKGFQLSTKSELLGHHHAENLTRKSAWVFGKRNRANNTAGSDIHQQPVCIQKNSCPVSAMWQKLSQTPT